MNIFRKIPRNVFILGTVSFFNDLASEMIYPIVPIFLTSVLHAPVSVVGLIEGIAEGSASIFKFIFGYWSDKLGKRKVFVISGYISSAISKPLIGIAFIWPLVLFARFFDRLGKGLRTSARDSILLQNTKTNNKGFIFGFHRALDSLGAVVGPLIAVVLLDVFHENLRFPFFAAFIPGIIAVLLLFFFVKEKKEASRETEKLQFTFNLKTIHPKFWFFFAVSMFFALGNSSDTFLLLRAKNLGLTTTLTILVYVLYNISQSVFAIPAGSLADKIGAKKVYALGLLVFSVVYFLFAWITSPLWIWFLFPIYGLYIAATDGVSKAYISEFISHKESGSYFGLYLAGSSLATFFASLIGGLLWTIFNPSVTFYYGSLMAGIAFILLMFGNLFRINRVR